MMTANSIAAVAADTRSAQMHVSVTVVRSCSVESGTDTINVRCSRAPAAAVRITTTATAAVPRDHAVSGMSVAIPLTMIQRVDRPASEQSHYEIVQLNF